MYNALYGALMRFTYVSIKFCHFKEFHGLESTVFMNRYIHMAGLNVLGLLCDSVMEVFCVIWTQVIIEDRLVQNLVYHAMLIICWASH